MLCMCVNVSAHSCMSGSRGVPGSPVFTDRKCLSRQKGRNLASPQGKHCWIRTKTNTRGARDSVKRGIRREFQSFVSETGCLVFGEVGVTGLGTNCSSLPLISGCTCKLQQTLNKRINTVTSCEPLRLRTGLSAPVRTIHPYLHL